MQSPISRLSPVQRAMFDVLMCGQPVLASDLVQHIYSTCKDGGPLWRAEAVRVQIHRMRRKGIDIRWMGRRRGYAVVLSSTQATATSKD